MAPGVSSCLCREIPPSISFSGCGFMATYQVGVAQCLLNYAPWILRTAPCVLGASAGSLVAAAVVCEINLVSMRDEMLHFAKQMKTFTLGPFNPSINVLHWLEFILHKHLPSNAHQLATGRLAVAVTRMTDRKPVIMSDFGSKEDVVQALLCSCFVPGYCGMMAPSYKGIYYVDGGFSNMQPGLPLPYRQILTVCPFSGEMDICPTDTSSMLDMVVAGATLKGSVANSIRFFNALYPMALEPLEKAYESGYKDAIDFLLNNDIVPYLMVHEEFQGPLNCKQNKTWVHLDKDVRKDEEMIEEMDTFTLTSFTGIKCKQRGSSAEQESPETPALHFNMVKNVMFGDMVSYLSMFGLPARILSHLFLPLMLSFYTALQGRHRLELLFRQTPEMMFWTWQILKYITLFIFNIIVSTLKKNVKDWIMPSILLLKWVKIHVKIEDTQKYRNATACNNFSTLAVHSEDVSGTLRRRFIAPSQENKITAY